jgi:ATP-dependent Lhr-like helicase
MALEKRWDVDEALRVVRRSYCYHELSKESFISLLHYLAGHYAELEDRKVYGKLWFDEDEGTFGRRGKYTRIIYYLNLGAIPDEVKIDVYLLPEKRYVGGIEEGFLERLRRGDIFVLGGRLYKFRYARGMRCYVERVGKDASPTIPAWFSEMLPLSFDLALEIQKFRGTVREKLEQGESREEIIHWIKTNYPVDENSANSIYEYFREQFLYTKIPGYGEFHVEETYDLAGRRFIVFHALYGRRVNDALSRAAAVLLSDMISHSVAVMVSDNGFALLVPKQRKINIERLLDKLKSCNLEELLKKSIRRTELMKRRFRHCAARSFLVLRNYKGYKISVSKQQLSSQSLLKAVEEVDPNFPVIQETYREILRDVMDIERAERVLRWLRDGRLSVEIISTPVASPFAHNLIILGEADVIFMEDRKRRLLELHEAIMRRIAERAEVEVN